MFASIDKPPEIIRYADATRHLILRRGQVSHASLLVEALEASLPELHRFMPWAHFPAGNTVDAQKERIQRLVTAWDAGSDFNFHMFLPQEDGQERFVGCVGLHPRCLSKHGLEVGYWVRSDAAGQGICTLAVQMVVLAGFRIMGLKRIQIGCDIANMASRRVIEKVGFQFEGIQRNMGECNPPADAVAKGWSAKGHICSHALIPEDLDGLVWPQLLDPHVQFE